MINLCRIRWKVNMCKWEKWKCKPIALWAVINDDFQYHIMAHLCNDYPPMVITYCCLAKGNPGLIWLHVNRVYVWENVSRVWESGNRKTWGTARWGARRNKRAFYTMMQCPISFLCWLRSCSLLVLGHTSPHILLSSSHHGTWQRSSICSLKFNLTTYGTVVFRGWEGRGGRGGSVTVMGAGVCVLQDHVSTCKPLLELLYIQVTFVWGFIVCSTRLIRKVSQFTVPPFYAAPTAHTCVCVCVCVCVCAGAHVRTTHETSTFHIIFNG